MTITKEDVIRTWTHEQDYLSAVLGRQPRAKAYVWRGPVHRPLPDEIPIVEFSVERLVYLDREFRAVVSTPLNVIVSVDHISLRHLIGKRADYVRGDRK